MEAPRNRTNSRKVDVGISVGILDLRLRKFLHVIKWLATSLDSAPGGIGRPLPSAGKGLAFES